MSPLSSTAPRSALASLKSTTRLLAPRPAPSICSKITSSKAVQLPSSRLATTSSSRSYSQSASSSPSPNPRQRSLPLVGAAALALVSSSYYFLSSDDSPVLAPDRWTPVKIESVERLTSDTSLFRINAPKTILPPAVLEDLKDGNARPILSLFVKEPTLQIQRAYTPLSATCFNPDGSATLELVIKRYSDGEVSRYLHRLGKGDEMEIRAPSVTWYYRPKDWDEVVFIAGGTGVTPAFQCINDSPASPSIVSPIISLLYASSSPSNIFLRQQLDELNAKNKQTISKIQYHVDRLDDPKGNATSLPTDTKLGMINRKSLEEFLGRKQEGKRKVVVICGPEGMINAIAGPRGRNFSQGPVGGYLKELGYTENEVVKL